MVVEPANAMHIIPVPVPVVPVAPAPADHVDDAINSIDSGTNTLE